MKRIAFILTIFALLGSCIDEVDLGISSNGTNPKILIVEATLTNELKHHRVVLSRMDTLTDLGIDSVYNPYIPIRDINRDLVPYEPNATVSIQDGSGTVYGFNETSPGVYESSTTFAAEPSNTYTLNIATTDGATYSSKAMQIEGVSTIADIYAAKTTNASGIEGLGIFLDNSRIEGNVKNLRYTYEETYKVIAPNWTPKDFQLTNYDPCALPVPTYDLEIVDRETEQQTCYGNALSNTIIQTQNTNTNSSGINNFMVHFIAKDNYILTHRYSIEVTQSVAGSESYGFYEQLNNFSQSGNIFSQVQPGFLEGNLSSDDGRQGTVIGFFDVVSVSKKRLFFNYTDFYEGEPLPPYPFNCIVKSAPESHESYCYSGPSGPNPCPQSIIEQVNLDLISYVGPNSETGECPGPYLFVPRICGDCTLLGSNVVPDFWEE
ncbi:DUF4249 family protein [Maribacter sp. LLG6340-A2]|uniref:DUF4249 family protein n=1 Tax=Maribacter sp. LLG6340-A2 TaxID=3160834 RepID=UPI0038663C8A